MSCEMVATHPARYERRTKRLQPEMRIRTPADTAIRIDGLSKCYHIYSRPQDRLKQLIVPRIRRILRRPSPNYFREFWALKDISFDVKKGETIGIIGRNGSGKSTLLQLICGILDPTRGTLRTNGRIAALLELGSGFNPEFTGRENVYLNGAVLGLSPREITDRFDAIAAFADIGNFIEQPVKTYSSGMAVRLAFAVAINIDPQILIVDEALAVGDELFQRKCYSRIETIKRSGATVVLVSHSGATIVDLCDRALLIDCGEALAMGNPKLIVGNYQRLLYAPPEKHESLRHAIRASQFGMTGHVQSDRPRPGQTVSIPQRHAAATEVEEAYDPHLQSQTTLAYESRGATIERAEIRSLTDRQLNCLKCGNSYRYSYTVRFDRKCHDVRFGMMMKAMNGTELCGIGSAPSGQGIESIEAGTIVTVSFQFRCSLLPGIYFMNAGCSGKINAEDGFLHRIVDAVAFRVLPLGSVERAGYVDLAAEDTPCQIKVSR